VLLLYLTSDLYNLSGLGDSTKNIKLPVSVANRFNEVRYPTPRNVYSTPGTFSEDSQIIFLTFIKCITLSTEWMHN